MDPRCSAQNILLCDSCNTEPLQSHCALCHVDLCTVCVGKHMSDSSKTHNVVTYSQKIDASKYPKCLIHFSKLCELYCEECHAPACAMCISDNHNGHKVSDMLKKLISEKKILRKDLEELESRIFPEYEGIVSHVKIEEAKLETDYENLTMAVDEHGEVLRQEIAMIVSQHKSDIEEIKRKHLSTLNEYSEDITRSIDQLNNVIQHLKGKLKSNDITLISAYKSRNAEFRRLPPKIQITLPTLSPPKINRKHLLEVFGSLSTLNIEKEESGYITNIQAAPLPVKPQIDEPRITASIDTESRPSSVSCLSDEEIWTCGKGKVMQLHNLKGELLKSVHSASGNTPRDIAVTHGGNLVYTDPETRTVNMVKNDQIQPVFRMKQWKPLFICSTASDDLLVAMISDDKKQSKVVRYSGSTETQTIQFDEKRQPLYSTGDYKYISENKNLDICVADDGAEAVVVVNQLGKFRFRYIGHVSNTSESFDLRGIATNSQGHILAADRHKHKHRVHIIDQDGQFLRYIDNFSLLYPCGLCVDSKDNLFVSEYWSGKVKKIKYLI